MRVCLLADCTGVREYFISALERMDAPITLVVVNENAAPGPETVWEAMDGGLRETVSYLRRQVVDEPTYLRRRPLDSVSLLSGVERCHIKPISAPDELGHSLPEKTVSEITNRADIVIRHGFGILQGDILSATDHGVLSFHHGDIRRYRGVAQGFWNFLADEPVAGITLQRLTPQLDGGEIVAYREVDIEDCLTWQEVRARLYEASIPMLAAAISNIADPDFSPTEPDSLGELYTKSDLYRPGTLAHYLLKNNIGRLRRRFGGEPRPGDR